MVKGQVLQQIICGKQECRLDEENGGIFADADGADGGNPLARVDHAEDAVVADEVQQRCGDKKPNADEEQVSRHFMHQRVFGIDKGQGDRQQREAKQEEVDVVFEGQEGGR